MREIKHLSVHQWLRSAIPDSQQPTSPIGFLFLKLPPPPCAVLLVRPVGWSDLTFQEDQLSGFDGRAVTECPGVIVLIVERRWHRESTDFW